MIVIMIMMMMSGLPGAGSRLGQAAGPRGEDHGGGDRDQEAGDRPLQVQVHHAQQRGQGKAQRKIHLFKFKSITPSVITISTFDIAASLYC